MMFKIKRYHIVKFGTISNGHCVGACQVPTRRSNPVEEKRVVQNQPPIHDGILSTKGDSCLISES